MFNNNHFKLEYMLENNIKIQLLIIANDLSKAHKLEEFIPGDYTIQRILSTYLDLYRSFEEVDTDLANNSSDIFP